MIDEGRGWPAEIDDGLGWLEQKGSLAELDGGCERYQTEG